MAKTATIDVDSELIRWARESAGLSVPQAAKRVGVKPALFEEWEGTAGRPTARQLERLADAVKRPVATFFMAAPPDEPPLPVDFRVAPGEERQPLPPSARLAIRRARRLQHAYVEFGMRDVFRAPPNIDRAQGPAVAAATIRSALAVPVEDQMSWRDPDVALKKWRAKVEAFGVLVFQFPMPDRERRGRRRAVPSRDEEDGGDRDSVSGFSLANAVDVAVLNKRDNPARRSFTLFHEWAHLLLGEPGVCDVEDGRIIRAKQQIEVFCNAFAAEALVPVRALLESPIVASAHREDELPTAAKEGARLFSVSRWVILRRLLSAQVITQSAYDRVTAGWAKEKVPQRKGGPVPPYRTTLTELGVPFVKTALEARSRGAISDGDLADYLSPLRLKHVEKLESLLPSA